MAAGKAAWKARREGGGRGWGCRQKSCSSLSFPLSLERRGEGTGQGGGIQH